MRKIAFIGKIMKFAFELVQRTETRSLVSLYSAFGDGFIFIEQDFCCFHGVKIKVIHMLFT